MKINNLLEKLNDLKESDYLQISKGGDVFTYEDKADNIYLILKGRIILWRRQGEEEVQYDFVTSGDFFGEEAFLTEVRSLPKRSSRASAVVDTVCISLPADKFLEMIMDDKSFIIKVIMGLTRRIKALEQADQTRIVKEAILQDSQDSTDDSTDKGSAVVGQDNDQSNDESNDEVKDKDDDEKVQGQKEPQIDKPTSLYLPGHGDYPDEAPEKFAYYLYDKEIECPVCGNEFEVKKIRGSRLRLMEFGRDLRPIYENFKSSWYRIWVCPNCLYAYPRMEFFDLSRAEIKNVKNNFRDIIIQQTSPEFSFAYSEPRILNEVFIAYYLSLELFKLLEPTSDKPAGSWLRLSWLYRDAGDEQLAKEASAKAKDFLQEFYFNEKLTGLSREGENKITLLLASLFIEHGDPKEALPLLDKIIRKGGVKPTYKRIAKDRFAEVREKIKESDQ